MRIIIEHNGIKREIVGSGFNICGSPEDLDRIADIITRKNPQGFGWVQIRDPMPDEHSAKPNTPPLPWAQH
jgi:hypothetical protein